MFFHIKFDSSIELQVLVKIVLFSNVNIGYTSYQLYENNSGGLFAGQVYTLQHTDLKYHML